jgi:hypothetical protein
MSETRTPQDVDKRIQAIDAEAEALSRQARERSEPAAASVPPKRCACGHTKTFHLGGDCSYSNGYVATCSCEAWTPIGESPEGAAPAVSREASGFKAKTDTNSLQKCDGNHGGPQCADPECWNGGEPAASVPQGGEFTALEVEAAIATSYLWGRHPAAERTLAMLRAYARALSSAPGERT